MQKNCVFVIENSTYYLDKMIKNFWYQDVAPFDLYLVYEPKCGTTKEDLVGICQQWNNPNFVSERIISIEDVINQTLSLLRSKGLDNIGEGFLQTYKMRSKIIAPIYFKQILNYESAMLLDDDVLVIGPIAEHFDGTWRAYTYCFNALPKKFPKTSITEFETVRDKIIAGKNSSIGKWMHAFYQNDIFDDVWSKIDPADYRTILMNSGQNTYVNPGMDAFVEYIIKFCNHPQLNELYRVSLDYYGKTNATTKTSNRGIPAALWVTDELIHQHHLHRMVLDGHPVSIDTKRIVVLMQKWDENGNAILPGINSLLNKHIIHYMCGTGATKRVYVDLIDAELEKIGYKGNQSPDTVMSLINKIRNKPAKPINPDLVVLKYVKKFNANVRLIK